MIRILLGLVLAGAGVGVAWRAYRCWRDPLTTLGASTAARPDAALREQIRDTETHIANLRQQVDALARSRNHAWTKPQQKAATYRDDQRLGAEIRRANDRRRQYQTQASQLWSQLCSAEGLVNCARQGHGPLGLGILAVAASALLLVGTILLRPQ